MLYVSTSKLYLSTVECETLKQKRSVVKSVIQSVRGKFNVSIAEIGQNNVKKKALLGLCFVSNDKRFSEGVLSKVITFIDRRYPGRLDDYDLEIYAR